MLTFYPSYYEKFECKADKCVHSCCRDWEIDINVEALKKYNSVQGEMGEEIRNNIANTPEPHFVLTKDGACPFLNKDGLCRIIINLGQDHLCDICRLHPRFFLQFTNCREIGLGMCCEAAAELILDESNVVYWVIGDVEPDDVLTIPLFTQWEQAVLNKRADYFDLLRNKSGSFSQVRNKLLKSIGIDGLSLPFKSLIKILMQAEILDKNWEELLKYALNAKADKKKVITDEQIRNVLAYFIFRHVTLSEDELALEENLLFSIISTDIIVGLCNFYNNDKSAYDICRMYSSEIEYSTTNKDYLMCKIGDFDLHDIKDTL